MSEMKILHTRRYHPHLNYKSVNKRRIPIRIFCIFCLAGAIAMHVLGDSRTIAFLLTFTGIGMLGEDIIWIIQTMEGGYKLLDDGICYWWYFRKYKVLYKDIKSIYITNSSIQLPYVLIIGGEEHGVLQYCMEKREKNRILLNTELESILVKNQETESNYGFLWNSREIKKILEHYKGDYYIAESIIQQYRQEYDCIYERYGIEKRVYVIDDCENRKMFNENNF
ncbi:MAG: hypothetical protein NC089_10885 [Bacteroides sp.]|nr:hypothetical protein [Bacteroides sp.]MCM1551026.1 hypothetical protein [Clostridium sp.]